MAHRNAVCVWRSKKRTTQRTQSPPCNTVVGVLCCGDQFIWNVESSQGVRNCEKRRICEDLWRQWHNYKSLFYRSKSRFDFGHSSYCDTAQLSRLCDWSAHYWSLFQVTFSSFVPFWLHPSCLISTVQAGVDGVGNISLAYFGPLCFPQSIIGCLCYILHLCSNMIILHVPQFICSLACISLTYQCKHDWQAVKTRLQYN